jgi:hypothetical protein
VANSATEASEISNSISIARGGGTVRTADSQVNYKGVNRQREVFALYRFSLAMQVRFTVQGMRTCCLTTG